MRQVSGWIEPWRVGVDSAGRGRASGGGLGAYLDMWVVSSLVGQVLLIHVAGIDHGLKGEQAQALDAGNLILVQHSCPDGEEEGGKGK